VSGRWHPVSEWTDDGDRLLAERFEAEKGGLQRRQILEVDGRPVSRFFGMNDSVVWNIVRSEGRRFHSRSSAPGKSCGRCRAVDRGDEWLAAKIRRRWNQPAVTPLVDGVEKDSPAEKRA